MAAPDTQTQEDREMEEGEPLTPAEERILDKIWDEDLDDEDVEDLSPDEVDDMIG
jgi:hypothetical protein